jgi:hypothetical protein
MLKVANLYLKNYGYHLSYSKRDSERGYAITSLLESLLLCRICIVNFSQVPAAVRPIMTPFPRSIDRLSKSETCAGFRQEFFAVQNL